MLKVSVASFLLLMSSVSAFASDELCVASRDTALFADAGLTEEVRPVFQFDGAQFVPESKGGDVMYGMAYDHLMQQMLEDRSYVRASDWTCEDLANAELMETTKEYDVTAEACQLELSDTRLAVSSTSLGFYESSCDIVSEDAGDGSTRLLSLQCYGSGEEWPAKGSIKELDDGSLSIEVDGYSQVYMPCN